MNRRAFFGIFAAGAAAAAVDPERLLWTPGKKLISIPAPATVSLESIYGPGRVVWFGDDGIYESAGKDLVLINPYSDQVLLTPELQAKEGPFYYEGSKHPYKIGDIMRVRRPPVFAIKERVPVYVTDLLQSGEIGGYERVRIVNRATRWPSR